MSIRVRNSSIDDVSEWALTRDGYDRVVDVDLQAFFDRVNHDGLMASATRFVSDSLRLTVNPPKSAVDRPWNRKFPGFTVSRNGVRLKVADPAMEKHKDRIRELTRRTRGTNIGLIVAELGEFLPGWKAYFAIAEVLSPLCDIDKWVRRKLRGYPWKQWRSSRYRELRKRGVSVREASPCPDYVQNYRYSRSVENLWQ